MNAYFFANTVTETLAIALLVVARMMLLTSIINFRPMATSGFYPKYLVKNVGKKEDILDELTVYVNSKLI